MNKSSGDPINDVSASVKFPWNETGELTTDEAQRQTLTVTAFWTGDLSGGGADFQQVVAESVPGGQAVRREYWMMPMPGNECAASEGGKSESCQAERANFMPWYRFVEYAYDAAYQAPAGNPPRIEVIISVQGKPSGWWSQTRTLECTAVLGRSALVALRNPHTNARGAPGWLTLPCR